MVKMLLQNIIPHPVEGSLPFGSNLGQEDLMCEWVPAKSWTTCSEHGEFSKDGSGLLYASNCYEVSGSNVMCKRRKLQKNSVIMFTDEPETDVDPAFSDSSTPLKNIGDGICGGLEAPITSIDKCAKDLDGMHNSFDCEFQSTNFNKGLVSDSFSSHSVMRAGPKTSRTEVFDLEFADSELDLLGKDMSIKDICISILKRHGLLVGHLPMSNNVVSEIVGKGMCSDCFQSCEICGNTENTKNMLLCDHCEAAFHVSCCNIKRKLLHTDEWFCQSCSKLRDKISLENSLWKSRGNSGINGRPKLELGPIESMLKYPETYASRVRIGRSFQAEVPEWSDQITKDSDCIGEPLEMDPAGIVGLHGYSMATLRKSNCISNWLQCREALYDDDARECAKGTICGKWRRAPLYEVQTDDWDCSCAVLWDPLHSDCAVPQELETDKILLQLKCIEQLSSRLANKKGT